MHYPGPCRVRDKEGDQSSTPTFARALFGVEILLRPIAAVYNVVRALSVMGFGRRSPGRQLTLTRRKSPSEFPCYGADVTGGGVGVSPSANPWVKVVKLVDWLMPFPVMTREAPMPSWRPMYGSSKPWVA